MNFIEAVKMKKANKDSHIFLLDSFHQAITWELWMFYDHEISKIGYSYYGGRRESPIGLQDVLGEWSLDEPKKYWNQ